MFTKTYPFFVLILCYEYQPKNRVRVCGPETSASPAIFPHLDFRFNERLGDNVPFDAQRVLLNPRAYFRSNPWLGGVSAIPGPQKLGTWGTRERYCPESRLVRVRLATNSRTLSASQFHTHAVIFNVTDLIHELLKRRFR